MDRQLKRSIFCFVVLLYLASSPAVAGYFCDEAIVPSGKIWQHPELPKPSKNQQQSRNFCNSNPNKFHSAFGARTPNREPVVCYMSDIGEIVIELPNQLFSQCILDAELERVLGSYAFGVAKTEKREFTLVVYNQKHFFYKKGQYGKNHAIFDRVLDWEYHRARNNYVIEKMKAGVYSIDTAACLILGKTLDGKPCPADLLEQFPLERPR